MRSVFRCAIVVLALCALLPVAAGAEGPISFGVKGGLSYANVTPSEIGSGLGKFERKWGPVGGAFALWNLSQRHALQLEVLYVSKGLSFGESEATDDVGNPIGTFETLEVVDYLEVPVLVHAAFPLEGALRPAILLGGAVGFKLDEKRKNVGAFESSVTTDAFKDLDYSVTVGAELRLRTGPGWSLIEARYTQGLTDIAEDFFNREVKNRTFTFMAGYVF